MGKWGWWLACILATAAIAAAETVPAPPPSDAPVVTRETAKTPEGTVTIWRRTPATEADLEMPVCGHALVVESFAYRVRDRKKRDLMRYARIDLTSARPVDEVLDFYHGALGKDVARETDAKTGEITLTSGVEGNLRLVTIAPKAGYCDLRLERVQRYAIPPRVFTPREQQALRVLRAVEKTYRGANRVAFRVAQTFQMNWKPKEQAKIPTLTWSLDITRPQTVAVEASVDGVTALKMTTRGDGLLVSRQNQPDETRALKAPLDLAQLPELQSDPVSRLLLGDDLASARLDFLDLQAVPGVPRQARLVLTYPEESSTITLTIDLATSTVLQSAVVLAGEEKRRTTMLRDYTNIILAPASAPAPAAPATPRSQTAPPAVTGP
jgi:hypothetical protein